jgi:hypothetical protein
MYICHPALYFHLKMMFWGYFTEISDFVLGPSKPTPLHLQQTFTPHPPLYESTSWRFAPLLTKIHFDTRPLSTITPLFFNKFTPNTGQTYEISIPACV